LRPAQIWRLVVLNDADSEPQKRVELTHPFRIAAGQVVVDGDHVNAAPAQSIQIDGCSGYQRLALAGRHLGDAAPMEDDSADELHVEMDHFPGRRLVADRERVLAIGKTSSALLYYRERLGQNFLQASLESF
jgi:hypothetical protein